MANRRRQAEQRGRWAESLAILALRLRGYRLLARRFKSGSGEIDLIMRKGDVTAFIEVKHRTSRAAALEAVTAFQARRIAAAAATWMAKDPAAARQFCRFDIVTVTPYQWPQHIENAFEGIA